MVIWLNLIKLHDNPSFCPVWLQIESLKEALQTLHPHAFHSHISKRLFGSILVTSGLRG